MATMQHALLTLGFASMALQDFKSAQNYFSLAQQENSRDDGSARSAAVHEADACFMMKSYSRALSLYNKILISDSDNADYARYQKAILLGLQEKYGEKISTLKMLADSDHPSVYATTARYELANTYIDLNKYDLALDQLKILANNPNDNTYASRAWNKLGFVYQQKKNIDEAIAAYRHILVDFPAAEERLSALDALKNLYIQINKPGEFSALLRQYHLPGADSASIDSNYYSAAELQYSLGKWSDAILGFTQYLNSFPAGVFAIKAHYYRAECHSQEKDSAGLEDYKAVLQYPWNDFSENSAWHGAAAAVRLADTEFARKCFSLVIQHSRDPIRRQDAYAGLMNGYVFEGKMTEAGVAADSLLAQSALDPEVKEAALLVKANVLKSQAKSAEAFPIYRQLCNSRNGEVAAESRYNVAASYLQQDSLDKAEAAANESIKLSTGYDYWIVKTYILFADIFVKQNDFFNAEATLESVVKHTRIEALKSEATNKLEAVKKQEQIKTKLKD
jgi:tetratricopeptide (TPR) repeat protein